MPRFLSAVSLSFLLVSGLSAAEGGPIAQISSTMAKGGTTMWFIAAVSIFGLAITLERMLRLRRDRIAPAGLAAEAKSLWAQGRHQEIVALCDRSDSVLGQTIKAMVEHRDAALQDVRTLVGDIGSTQMRIHHRRAHLLTVAATLSPLLGLFGTVYGMIQAFEDFRLLGETGDPTVFAGAISLALITTAGGLIVAMPCLALYHFFKSRTNALSEALEEELQGLLSQWFMKQAAAPAAAAAG